jgi:dTDP-L-rhamnose 4-epimerase
VTGGAGFIGSHVADELAASGCEPILLDSLLPQAHGSGAVPDYVGGHSFVRGEVSDAPLLRELLSEVDAVCHQAAVVGHGLDPSDAPAYALNNDYGTAVLLAEMYAAGVTRLVLASSMVVYGEGRYTCVQHGIVPPSPRRQSDVDAGRFEPTCTACGRELAPLLVPEDAALRPQSTYAATKLAQEHLAGAWARQTGGTVWALRYHNVYGPRMPQNTPYAGVASLFRSALLRGEPPTVLEDGNQLRDFVHVHDVARANVLALLNQPGSSDALQTEGPRGAALRDQATPDALIQNQGDPGATIRDQDRRGEAPPHGQVRPGVPIHDQGHASNALPNRGWSSDTLQNQGHAGDTLQNHGHASDTLREQGWFRNALRNEGWSGEAMRGQTLHDEALQDRARPGELIPVNICSGTPHTVGELAAELARACHGPAPQIVGGARPADVRHVVADPARAEKLLGFRAAIGFEAGIAAFAKAPLRASASGCVAVESSQ